jgi:hypothetical protein
MLTKPFQKVSFASEFEEKSHLFKGLSRYTVETFSKNWLLTHFYEHLVKTVIKYVARAPYLKYAQICTNV